MSTFISAADCLAEGFTHARKLEQPAIDRLREQADAIAGEIAESVGKAGIACCPLSRGTTG